MKTDDRDGATSWISEELVGLLFLFAVGVLAGFLPSGHPIRLFVAFVSLLFIPGYVLTLAVFPADDSVSRGRRLSRIASGASGPAGLGTWERLALSFGLSILLLPAFALVIELVSLPYEYTTVGSTVGVFCLLTFAVGSLRRRRLEPSSRYDPKLSAPWLSVPRGEGLDLVLNAALAITVVATLAGLGVALAVPPEGDGFTEVSLLTEDTNGDLSASDYPAELTRNETTELVLTVTNRESKRNDYNVVVQLQELNSNGTVTERATVDIFENDVGPGETWRARHDLQLFRPGEDQRVMYLVYRGTPPESPTVENAYRHVYFWTDVKPVTG